MNKILDTKFGSDSMENLPLANQVAIVTGGAQGIGMAVCQVLARDGASVVIADTNAQGAEVTASTIDFRPTLVVDTDVSSEPSVRQLYTRTRDRFGRIDILVNNAGIFKKTPILEIELDEWERIMAVNLRGTFLMSREAFRIMKEQRSGNIVSIASLAGKNGGLVAGAHYSASKAGIMCLTKSLALQAAPYRIRVNAVCPGPTCTELTDNWGEEMNRAVAEKIPWNEYARPQDVAEAVGFLVSERARYITGEILDVNGGLIMD